MSRPEKEKKKACLSRAWGLVLNPVRSSPQPKGSLIMKTCIFLLVTALLCLAIAKNLLAQGTAFTHQGPLMAAGAPARKSNEKD
jgi:hypothetical protein